MNCFGFKSECEISIFLLIHQVRAGSLYCLQHCIFWECLAYESKIGTVWNAKRNWKTKWIELYRFWKSIPCHKCDRAYWVVTLSMHIHFEPYFSTMPPSDDHDFQGFVFLFGGSWAFFSVTSQKTRSTKRPYETAFCHWQYQSCQMRFVFVVFFLFDKELYQKTAVFQSLNSCKWGMITCNGLWKIIFNINDLFGPIMNENLHWIHIGMCQSVLPDNYLIELFF